MVNKIIILRLKGGLGNQLFMYAAAFSFCKKNDVKLLVDGTTGFWADSQYERICRLDRFNISARIFFLSLYFQPIAFFSLKIFKAVSQIFRLNFYLDQSHATEEITNNSYFRYIEGYWQSESYFSEYASLIKAEFTLKENQSDALILKEICNSNSVGIHVRFFSEDTLTEAYLTYYKNAIQAINEIVINPVFYIFSDDIVKTKKIFFGLIDKPNFVDCANSEIEDFIFLRSCKNFIGSDSTFFWWAAWLSDAPKKIITYPRHLSAPKNFYPDEWLAI